MDRTKLSKYVLATLGTLLSAFVAALCWWIVIQGWLKIVAASRRPI